MNRRLGLFVGVTVLGLTCLIGRIVIRYLPNHDERWSLALAILAGGFVISGLLYALIRRLPPTRRTRIVVLGCLALFVLAPPVASVVIRRVTFARFGFTVYGLIPVPFLDITVNARGMLGFREKTHRLGFDEVQELLTADVEVVVIGTGWDNLVVVEDSVRNLPGVTVTILPTPQALEHYNALVFRGVHAILLAHSTC